MRTAPFLPAPPTVTTTAAASKVYASVMKGLWAVIAERNDAQKTATEWANAWMDSAFVMKVTLAKIVQKVRKNTTGVSLNLI